MHGGNAVADALDRENLNSLANLFRATDFACMHQAMQSGGGGGFVHGKEIFGGDTELVAADSESNNFGRATVFGGLDDTHRRGGPELADSVKNPTQGKAARLKRLGGAQD